MSEAEVVWNANKDTLTAVIKKIMYSYNLEEHFFFDSQRLFFQNFDKYFENKSQYFGFFNTCISNRAKNVYRSRKRNSKNISVINTDEGYVDAYEFVKPISHKDNPESELFVDEVGQIMKTVLDDHEYFVYENLLEGWTERDIAKMLNVKVVTIQDMVSKIQGEVKKLL
jgi:DNA-directed RNA polymerase specialized sigma24 family protein